MIEDSRRNVFITVNATITQLYWGIGCRINEVIAQYDGNTYGKQIVATLWRQLSAEYGNSFSEKNIRRMMQFADVFTNELMVEKISKQISWSHIKLLIPMRDQLKIEFYIGICHLEKWSVRQLQERIKSMLYERTIISKKNSLIIESDLKQLYNENAMSSNLVFRDPYMLDFLGLKDTYSEKDLELAIVSELQRFIIELGNDFAFLARQKRITIDHRDYKMDLLFYHRRLKCLVVIDLKLGEFEASFKGQMELYLRYLEKYERVDGENAPIGLILCANKNREHIELLQLNQSNIHVAEYLTELPEKSVWQAKLHQAVELAQANVFMHSQKNE